MPRFELGGARSIAVILGLKEDANHPFSHPPRDEVDRLSRMLKFINNVNTPHSRELVLSNFCALYLPEVIYNILVAPDPSPDLPLPLVVQAEMMLYNAHSEILIHLFATPHFSKYMRSQACSPISCKMLIATVTWRLGTCAFGWDTYLRDRPDHWPTTFLEDGPLVRMLVLLFQLLVCSKSQEEVLSISLKNKLLPWVSKWAAQYPQSVPLGDYASRLRKILSNTGVSAKELKEFRSKVKEHQGWDSCAFSGCREPKRSMKELKACSRCQTVKYCCGAHQKEDWKHSHKYYCFETVDY